MKALKKNITIYYPSIAGGKLNYKNFDSISKEEQNKIIKSNPNWFNDVEEKPVITEKKEQKSKKINK